VTNVRTKLVVALAVVTGGAVLIGALTFERRPPAAPSLAASVTTATVTRQTLLDQFQANGTIGYSGAYTVLNQYSPPPTAATVASVQHSLDAAKQNLADTLAEIDFGGQQDAGAVANDRSQLTTDQQKLAADASCGTSRPDPACAQLQQAVSADQARLSQDLTKQQSDQLTNTQRLHQAQQQVTSAEDTYDRAVEPGSSGGGGAGAGGGGGGATGAYTALPAVGQTIGRGQTVYSVNDRPIPLLFGATPLVRQLTTGVSGEDVKELEDNLIALGYGSRLTADGSFTSADAAAVARWQAALGVAATGVVNPGEAVVLPDALRVATVKVQIGAPAQTGAEIIDGTSPSRGVTVDLDARRQTLVSVGAAASVALPNGSNVNGTITEVGTVATTTGQGAQQQTTIPVTITLADDSVAGKLDGATVTVSITQASHTNVLAVPVTALIALQDGGYAIETADRSHRRIPVQTGLFSNGMVEVSGPGVVEGLRVVSPSLT
jgi:hypothetical protein